MVGRCISYWTGPFSGDMLVFRGVNQSNKESTIQLNSLDVSGMTLIESNLFLIFLHPKHSLFSMDRGVFRPLEYVGYLSRLHDLSLHFSPWLKMFIHDIQHPIHASCRKQIQLSQFFIQKVERSAIHKFMIRNKFMMWDFSKICLCRMMNRVYVVLELIIMPTQGRTMSIYSPPLPEPSKTSIRKLRGFTFRRLASPEFSMHFLRCFACLTTILRGKSVVLSFAKPQILFFFSVTYLYIRGLQKGKQTSFLYIPPRGKMCSPIQSNWIHSNIHGAWTHAQWEGHTLSHSDHEI